MNKRRGNQNSSSEMLAGKEDAGGNLQPRQLLGGNGKSGTYARALEMDAKERP